MEKAEMLVKPCLYHWDSKNEADSNICQVL